MRLPILALALFALAGCAHGYGAKRGASPGAASASTAVAKPADPGTPAPAPAPPAGKVHKLADGLVYEDLVIGDGKMADPGLHVVVHYTGWLTNGEKFDSSRDKGRPFEFTIGEGRVIRGWEEGVKGMRIGGKRKLTIPPDLGWGERGTEDGIIPPNATTIFEVELLNVR